MWHAVSCYLFGLYQPIYADKKFDSSFQYSSWRRCQTIESSLIVYWTWNLWMYAAIRRMIVELIYSTNKKANISARSDTEEGDVTSLSHLLVTAVLGTNWCPQQLMPGWSWMLAVCQNRRTFAQCGELSEVGRICEADQCLCGSHVGSRADDSPQRCNNVTIVCVLCSLM